MKKGEDLIWSFCCFEGETARGVFEVETVFRALLLRNGKMLESCKHANVLEEGVKGWDDGEIFTHIYFCHELFIISTLHAEILYY